MIEGPYLNFATLKCYCKGGKGGSGDLPALFLGKQTFWRKVVNKLKKENWIL